MTRLLKTLTFSGVLVDMATDQWKEELAFLRTVYSILSSMIYSRCHILKEIFQI